MYLSFIYLLVLCPGGKVNNPYNICTFPDIHQPVREAVSYRGLFTAGWFGVREKHCSRLEIYDRLRASDHLGASIHQ